MLLKSAVNLPERPLPGLLGNIIFPGVGIVFIRYRVITVLTPRMAARQPPDCETCPAPETVNPEGLHGVSGAAGVKTTDRRKKGRDKPLINTDKPSNDGH
jgi:hypothetical protein